MINPIQQNVVFKGVDKVKGADNFTGNMPVTQSVRGNYRNTINDVVGVQQNMQAVTNEHLGNNLNTIA